MKAKRDYMEHQKSEEFKMCCFIILIVFLVVGVGGGILFQRKEIVLGSGFTCGIIVLCLLFKRMYL